MATRRARPTAPRSGASQSEETNDIRQTVSVPYQPRAFRDFISLIGRQFYDDGCIVLLDFLAREQKAFTDAELRERLRWRETLLQQKLNNLEKQLLVERVTEVEKGSKPLQLWRLQCHAFVSVEWRLKAMEQQVQAELRRAARHSDFQCSNPSCGIRVSLMDAAVGPTALDDDHPLCRNCHSPLTTADSEEARKRAEDKLRRSREQMVRLREALNRVRGMKIPEFKSTQVMVEPEATEVPPDVSVPSPSATPALSENVQQPEGPPNRDIPWFKGILISETPTNASNPAQNAQQSQSQSTAFRPQSASEQPLGVSRHVFGTTAQGVAVPPVVRPLTIRSLNLATGSSGPESASVSLVGSNTSNEALQGSDKADGGGRGPLKLSFGSGGSAVGSKPFSMSIRSGKGSDVGSGTSVREKSALSDVGGKRRAGSDLEAQLGIKRLRKF